MTERRTLTEMIEIAREEARQKENRVKVLLQRQKEQDRKVRTKRLIERGAILESMIDEPAALTNTQVKCFLEKTIKTEFARKIRASLNTEQGEAPAEKQAGAVQRGGTAAAQTGGGGTGQAGA